jgi:hypothetical protein
MRNKNELLMIKSQVEHLLEQLQAEQQIMRELIASNDKIAKRNEVVLFGIKEATINTIKDYQRVGSMLDKALRQEADPDELAGFLIGCDAKVATLEDSFSSVFNMTTDEYIGNNDKASNLQ